MPNRIIKESICESRNLAEVSFFAEDLYKRLITYADDYGRFNADYQIILARLYPREIGIVSIDDIEDAITELIGAGKIAFYTSTARKEIYGCFPNWANHQRVRDSKEKYPAPEDTSINDWYLKRFVSRDMKRRILERDGMKCQECGKYVMANVSSAERAIKFGAGLFHIDHIVPVNQGGRATYENLRLLCPSCNLRRKKRFTIEEIIEMSHSAEDCAVIPEAADSCRELPQDAASLCRNPNPNRIRNRNPNPNPNAHAREDGFFDEFWAIYPKKQDKQHAKKAFEKINPDRSLLDKMISAVKQWSQSQQWTKDGGQFIPMPATWLNGKRWEDEAPVVQGNVTAQQYSQRSYTETELEDRTSMNDLFAEAAGL